MLAAGAKSSRSWLVQFSVLALSALGMGAAAAEETLKPSRPYRDGPLTKADFAAQRPRNASTAAWSEFDYKWKYDYRYELKGGVYTVRLSELDIWAEFRRDKSWNRRPEDPVLLDHEQGHFDIAQAMAMAAVLKLSPRDAKNARIAVRHSKLEEAVRQLESAMTAAMQPFVAEAKQAHIDYDKATKSGAHVSDQALARKEQRERLQTLAADVERLPKK